MRGALLRLIVLLPCLCCCLAAPSLRGVDPRLKQYYQPADGSFSCLDGKKAVPLAWVNDDFCDCFDGSDEPGKGAGVAILPARAARRPRGPAIAPTPSAHARNTRRHAGLPQRPLLLRQRRLAAHHPERLVRGRRRLRYARGYVSVSGP